MNRQKTQRIALCIDQYLWNLYSWTGQNLHYKIWKFVVAKGRLDSPMTHAVAGPGFPRKEEPKQKGMANCYVNKFHEK